MGVDAEGASAVARAVAGPMRRVTRGHGRRGARLACVASCACGLWLACGDDSSGGGTSPQVYIHTGIDPNTSVGDLSAAEKQRLCEEVAEAVFGVLQDPRIVDGYCTLAGIVGSIALPTAERETNCENFVTNCSTLLTLPDLARLAANCGDPSPTCDATVGEVETCSNALIAAWDVFYVNLTCSGVAELKVVPVVLPPAGSCQDFQARCPALYAVPAMAVPATATR